jgi:outer membrane murein-binding lipoprotein Lpp
MEARAMDTTKFLRRLLLTAMLALQLCANAFAAAKFNTESELASKVATLEMRLDFTEKKIDSAKDYLSQSQKSIDWWASLFSIFMTIVGIGVPVLLALKYKSDFKLAVKEVEDANSQCKQYLLQIEGLLDQTSKAAIAAEINREKTTAALDDVARQLKSLDQEINLKNSVGTQDDSSRQQVAEEVKPILHKVIDDPHATSLEKLRARALECSSRSDYEGEAAMWQAIVTITPDDESASLSAATSLGLAATLKQSDSSAALNLLERASPFVERVLQSKDFDILNEAHYEKGALCLTKARLIEDQDEKENLILEGLSHMQTYNPPGKHGKTVALTYIGEGLLLQSKLKKYSDIKTELLRKAQQVLEDAIQSRSENKWAPLVLRQVTEEIEAVK